MVLYIQKNHQNYTTHLYEAREGWGKYPEWKYARVSAVVPGLSPRGSKGMRNSSAEAYGRKPSRRYSSCGAPASSILGTCLDRLREKERNTKWEKRTISCKMCRCVRMCEVLTEFEDEGLEWEHSVSCWKGGLDPGMAGGRGWSSPGLVKADLGPNALGRTLSMLSQPKRGKNINGKCIRVIFLQIY